MAKGSNNLAQNFETENTGGLLSGFLAEEDEFDRRGLWRIGSWGVGAVGAVIIAMMANQSSLGWRRDQTAVADLTRQAEQLQTIVRESHNDARRLAAAVDTLNSDRDRLYSRVTMLEQGLDSVTGAIARQSTTAAVPPTAVPPAAVAPVPVAEPKPTAPNPPPAPTVAAVTTTQAAPTTPEKPQATEKHQPTDKPQAADKIQAAERPQVAEKPPAPTATEPSPATAASASQDTPTPATPLLTSKSMMAPPDPAAGRLMEPAKPVSAVTATAIPDAVVSATVASDADDDESSAPKLAIQRTEFGVDLGSANSVSGLRALWRGLLKSRSNAPLTTLRPIIVVKEGTNGLGLQLRLVAGPLNDAGAAARICAVLAENDRACETTIFDGQRLTLKTEDPPLGVAKPAPRRRGATKRAALAEDPPRKPEAPTLSSLFGRKGQ